MGRNRAQPVVDPLDGIFLGRGAVRTESIGDDILQLSRSFDRGAGSFSLEELRKLLKIPQTVPDAVIDEAVKCAILPKPVNDE